MLTAIVIDDEPMALEVVQRLTEKLTFVELVGYFTNAFDAMGFLQKNKTSPTASRDYGTSRKS